MTTTIEVPVVPASKSQIRWLTIVLIVGILVAALSAGALAARSFTPTLDRHETIAPAVPAGGINPIVPSRVFDSRGFSTNGLIPGNWYAVGTGAQNIQTVFATITVTETKCPGFVTVKTDTGTPLNVSVLNWWTAGQIDSNSLFINVTNAGVFYVRIEPGAYGPGCAAHIIVDLNAWVSLG